jgi:hypothetical protein
MKLLYLGLRNISSERGDYSGAGTYNGTVALNTLTKLSPGRIPLCSTTIRSQITSDLLRNCDSLFTAVGGALHHRGARLLADRPRTPVGVVITAGWMVV